MKRPAKLREAIAEDFLDLICSRQSIAPKRLVEPGELEAIVRAACSHPITCAASVPRSGHRLAEVFVEAKRRRLPDDSPMMLHSPSRHEKDQALLSHRPLLQLRCVSVGRSGTCARVIKLLFLAIRNAGVGWRRDIEWTQAMSQFAMVSADRFPGRRAYPERQCRGQSEHKEPDIPLR